MAFCTVCGDVLSISVSSLLAVSPQYALRGTSSAVFCTASRDRHLLSGSGSRGVPCSISWVTNTTMSHIYSPVSPRWHTTNRPSSWRCWTDSFVFDVKSSRSPQVPPACLTLGPRSRPHSRSTLLPSADCVPPLTPHHSAYTTATSTSQAWEENSEFLSSSSVLALKCFFSPIDLTLNLQPSQ